MRIAVDDLKLDALHVIHAGTESFAMKGGGTGVALARVHDEVSPLAG